MASKKIKDGRLYYKTRRAVALCCLYGYFFPKKFWDLGTKIKEQRLTLAMALPKWYMRREIVVAIIYYLN